VFEGAIDLIDDTPALVVDWAVVERNVKRMAKLSEERKVRLRPHIKTHKMVPLAKLQMATGATGLTVAKLGEAQVMIDSGMRDIFVAYPVVGSTHVNRLLDLATRADVTVAVDSWEAAEPIAKEARRRSIVLGALVEVDTGLHRCGVAPGAPAVDLCRRIDQTPGLSFRGLMTHEGQAYAAGSEEGLRASTIAAGAQMKLTAEELLDAGITPGVVSMGSSGTARFGIGLDGITEFRPGTYVFNDRSQVALGACGPDDCAAAVVTTVVSRSQTGEAVIDAGSKTLTSDRVLTLVPPNTYGEVFGQADTQVVRLSEEHGILSGGVAGSLRVGDRLALLPNHICPVVNLFDEVHVIGLDGNIIRWPVDARGMSR
jgi:D-serine deaminase-like pyridoxal phosphate-dependent protein